MRQSRRNAENWVPEIVLLQDAKVASIVSRHVFMRNSETILLLMNHQDTKSTKRKRIEYSILADFFEAF